MKDPVRLNDLGTALGQQYGVAYLPSEFRKRTATSEACS